jgi:hypothetical protein
MRRGNSKIFKDVQKQSSKPRDEWEFKILHKIGKKIRLDLVNIQMSVDKLAIESETSRGSVRRVIEGKSNTSLVTLDRIVRVLGYKDVIDFFVNLDKGK